MEQQQILHADYLDILFDRRNKQYGGYDLRKHYTDRTRRALAGVLLFTAVIAAIPVIAGLTEGRRKHMPLPVYNKPDVFTPVNIYRQPKPAPPVHQHAAAPAARMVRTVVPMIRPTAMVHDEPKPVVPEHAITGPADGEGRPDAPVAGTGDASSTGTGTANTNVIGTGTGEPPAIVEVPDEQPEFNGNLNAYLQSHLEYPEEARAVSREGRVVVRFVVGEDGSITSAEVAKSADRSLDNEALRVVRSMPRWKPGRVKGKAVKAYFALPVTFRLD